MIEEINQDLGKPTPMLRLVQGDVGSGKTVVAAMAALVALTAGHQVALMAPTEILAEQHNRSFADWLAPLGLTPTLLTGSMKASLKKQHLADLESGSTQHAAQPAVVQLCAVRALNTTSSVVRTGRWSAFAVGQMICQGRRMKWRSSGSSSVHSSCSHLATRSAAVYMS